MAHFAEIDNNNIVTRVIVVTNEDCGNLDFPDSEKIGQQFIKSIGLEGKWLQTSYNYNFRGNFASAGYSYDQKLDAFLPPKPFESWTLNSYYKWQAPVDMPKNENDYAWNEEKMQWDIIPTYEVED